MLIDLFIILLLISSSVRGREIGLIRQVSSAAGFFGGLFLGAALQAHLVSHAHTQLTRAMLSLGTTLGCALIFLTIAEYAGAVIKSHVQQHKLNVADVALGAAAGGVSLLITVWLVAPVFATLPLPGLQTSVRRSEIVSWLNTNLPPAPNIIADLSHIINPNGFPAVFTGLEPAPNTNVALPNMGILQAAVNKDAASVVKIEGQGCGGIVEGSGFVVGNGFVATNAHVVAGIIQPFVLDNNGTHRATTVWFDPDLDLAVLRVKDLAGGILHIETGHIKSGTPGAVLGYPGGGPFTADPAAVLDEFIAAGRNIYNEGSTNRDVYEVRASIIPGNSGGPLIEVNGSVMGVVFAESTTYAQTGYALATAQVVKEIHQAEAANLPVSTGTCAQ